jgi:hypothetical protein
MGKLEVMFDTTEAFLFRGGNQLSVPQQRGSSIVVITGNSQDIQSKFLRGAAIRRV